MIRVVKYSGKFWYLVDGIRFRTYEDAARYYNDNIAKSEEECIPLF